MGFIEAVKSSFSNYANFKGRAVRSEYWYFVLFSFIVNGIATFVDMSNGYDTPELGPIEILVMLFLIIPNIAVTTRRLHDTDHSGWWQLLWIIPIIGWIILVVWWCTKGTPEANRFGETRYNSDDNINGQVKSVNTPSLSDRLQVKETDKERVDETQVKEVTSKMYYEYDGIKFDSKESMEAYIQNSPVNKTIEKPEELTTEKNMSKNKDIINKENFDDINDEEFYLTATKEAEGENINAALWAKCMAINTGDEKKSKYDYINRRVEILKNEAQADKENRIEDIVEAKRVAEEVKAKRTAEKEDNKVNWDKESLNPYTKDGIKFKSKKDMEAYISNRYPDSESGDKE